MQQMREILKYLFGVLFALAGANHFFNTEFYVSIAAISALAYSARLYQRGGRNNLGRGAVVSPC